MKSYPAIFLNLMALVFGAILPLAFAPFGVYPLSVLAVAVLLFVWLHSSPKQTFGRGFLFGLGFFSVGVYWIYISIHVYGNTSVPLALFITALLILVLSFYLAVSGYLLNRVFVKNSWYKIFLVFPLNWVLFEWIRGALFSGFPWLYLGYSQIDSPLRGFAPIIGVYGISFLVAFSAACLVAFCICQQRKERLAVLFLFLALWLSGQLLSNITWTQAEGNKINVSLIQGNISQELKWQPDQLNNILNNYLDLTKKSWDQSKIIIWPEAAISAFSSEMGPYLKKLDKNAKDHKATIITGIPISEPDGRYYNGILALGVDNGQYLKRHLVPFGEYIPLHAVFARVFKLIAIPMSDFSRGERKQPGLVVANMLIAPFICYEIAYPSLVLDYMPQAKLLLTISDDSWFDRSIALAQHLEIARMRSLEVGRYQLVVSNTGFTVIIDPRGKIIAAVPPFDKYILSGAIEPMVGETPFVYLMNKIRNQLLRKR